MDPVSAVSVYKPHPEDEFQLVGPEAFGRNGIGHDEIDRWQKGVRSIIQTLASETSYGYSLRSNTPVEDYNLWKSVSQKSEILLENMRMARKSFSTNQNSLRRKILQPGRKAKIDKLIADLSCELIRVLTEASVRLMQHQTSIYLDQERHLKEQRRAIKDIENAFYGQQLCQHSSPFARIEYLSSQRPISIVATTKEGNLSWLKAPGYSEDRHRAYSAMRVKVPETCTWLYETSEYKSWRRIDNNTQSCLWLYGKPGTGKSILMSKLVDDMSPGHLLAYFYMGHCRTQSAWDIASVLLKLLCKRSPMIPQRVRDLQLNCGPNTQPQLDELLQALEDIAVLGQGVATIFLDGWDECNMYHRDEFEKLFRIVTSLPCKVFVTSRTPCPATLRPINLLEVNICDGSLADLKAFIAERLNNHFSGTELSSLDDGDSLPNLVIQKIIDKSDHTFFLAEIHTKRILEQLNRRDIRATLEELLLSSRDTIHQAFDVVMSQQDNLRSLACTSLVWVANSRRPLTVEGLREGFSILPSVKLFIAKDALRRIPTFFSYALIALARTRLRYRISHPSTDRRSQSPRRFFVQDSRTLGEALDSGFPSRHTNEEMPFLSLKIDALDSPVAFVAAIGGPNAVFEIDKEAIPPKKAFLGNLGCSKGLIIQEPGSLNVLLAYDGIKEHLQSYRRNGFAYKIYDKELKDLALACLYYVLQTKFGFGPCSTQEAYLERLNANPFLEYAAICWPHHAKQAASTDVDFLVSKLFKSPNKLRSALQVYLLNNLPRGSESEFQAAKRSCESMTTLQVATRLNLMHLVKILIKEIDPLAPDCTGKTPLHEAKSHRYIDIFKLLFDTIADRVFRQDHMELTPGQFFEGVRDRGEIMQFYRTEVLKGKGLVEAISTCDFHGVIACLISGDAPAEAILKMAINGPSTDVVMALIRFATESEESSNAALLHAIKKTRIDVIKIILQRTKLPLPAEALVESVNVNNLDIIQLLLKHGTEPSHTALLDSIKKNRIDVLELLLQRANLPLPAEALIEAVLVDNLDMIELLIEYGIEASNAALLYSVQTRRTDFVKILLQGTKLPPLANAFLEAARVGSLDMIKLLIERGVDINAQAKGTGRGALHEAARNKSSVIVKYLLAKGADASQLDEAGRTPLFDAIKASDTASVRELLLHGVDIDAIDVNSGRQALHEAALAGDEEIMFLILNRSSNIDCRDNDQKTPYDYAQNKIISRLLHSRSQDNIFYAELASKQERPGLEESTSLSGHIPRRKSSTWPI